VETIKRIYTDYDQGKTVKGIAAGLNSEGIPASKGGQWQRSAVVMLLRNPVYCGDHVYNRRHQGKYQGIKDGKITSDAGRGKTDSSDWIVHPDHWPAIVSREQWNRVQTRLDRNAYGRAPKRRLSSDSKKNLPSRNASW
jgi:hypothetical protein